MTSTKSLTPPVLTRLQKSEDMYKVSQDHRRPQIVPSIYLPAYLPIYPSAYLPFYLFVCIYIYRYIYIYMHIYICYLSIYIERPAPNPAPVFAALVHPFRPPAPPVFGSACPLCFWKSLLRARKSSYTSGSQILPLRPIVRGTPYIRFCRILVFM